MEALCGLGRADRAVGAAKAFSSMGDQVAKMAKRTGLSVETHERMIDTAVIKADNALTQ